VEQQIDIDHALNLAGRIPPFDYLFLPHSIRHLHKSKMTKDMPWPQVPLTNKTHTEAAVVIVGAGISGLCTAIGLLTENKCHNFVIIEKSSGLGGTWRDNKYPGCCCDGGLRHFNLS
jgi:hypothetical protein